MVYLPLFDTEVMGTFVAKVNQGASRLERTLVAHSVESERNAHTITKWSGVCALSGPTRPVRMKVGW